MPVGTIGNTNNLPQLRTALDKLAVDAANASRGVSHVQNARDLLQSSGLPLTDQQKATVANVRLQTVVSNVQSAVDNVVAVWTNPNPIAT